MENLNIFLLFPESDEEISSMGDDIEIYKNVVKDLTEVKNTAQNVCYTLFYDSNNIDAFCNQAKTIAEETYLCKLNTQLLHLLKKNAINVANKPLFKSDCYYFQWNVNAVSLKTDNLLRSATENKINKADERTIIISFLNNDPWIRDIMSMIKYAPHYEGLPVMTNIPYFNPVGTFFEWYKGKLTNTLTPFCLTNVEKFERTNKIWYRSKQRIYKERETGRYWYFDVYHKNNKEHYEVFDSKGNHICEADTDGHLIDGTCDKEKSINEIL